MIENMKVQTLASGQRMELKFSGPISETSIFPEFSLQNISEITLDFGDVTYVNSAGVRVWVKWMWKFEKEKESLKFSIERCSPRIVRQIHAIQNFVPKSTSINSFLIPYDCSSCSHVVEKLFVTETPAQKNLDSLKQMLSASMQCPKCSAQMELDAIPDDYLSLMKAR